MIKNPPKNMSEIQGEELSGGKKKKDVGKKKK
jgi:hypothetical protein